MCSIEERIAKLERSNCRLRRTLVGVTAAGAVAVGLGMRQPDVVPDVMRTKRLEVVDDAGTARVVLSVLGGNGMMATVSRRDTLAVGITADTDGNGTVVTYHHEGEGHPLVSLGAHETQGRLAIYDSKSRPTVLLRGGKYGGEMVTLNDQGNPTVLINAAQRGDGQVTSYSREGTPTDLARARLPMQQSSGVPDVIQARRFEVVDEHGTVVVSLNSWELGGTIMTSNSEGNGLFWVVADEGGGLVHVLNGKGGSNARLVTLAATEAHDGALLLFDHNGALSKSIQCDD